MIARVALGLLVAALIALFAPGAASAAILNVTTTDDHEDKLCTVADCTLREAVDVGGSADTINVPAGTYSLTLGELVLSSDTIVGVGGARTTFIDGGAASRVLRASGTGTSRVSGVTIRNGNGVSGTSSGLGGGILLQTGTLALNNVAVTNNSAANGGGIAVAAGTLSAIGMTMSGNLASTGGRVSAHGGAILVNNGATALLGNVTLSSNTARDTTTPDASQGGGIYAGGNLTSINVTIAGNTAAAGGGLWQQPPSAAGGPSVATTMSNTIIAGNSGVECAGNGIPKPSAITSHHDLVDDASCMLTGAGEKQSVNPLLAAALANNGGPTDTRALPLNSPAVDAGSGCAALDQRGVARPNGPACDIGAFEFARPTLRVTTTVINDNGGTKVAANFLVHVKQGAAEASGSPQNGNASGTTFTLTPGNYSVSADLGTVTGYAATISGDCTAGGSITLAENQARACTITLNDVAPTLKVITTVVNDNGGTRAASGFSAHVKSGAADVAGSPAAGSTTGTTYTLNAGAYAVSADAVTGYTFSGCGAVSLVVGDAKTCTIIAGDVAPKLLVTAERINDSGGSSPLSAFSVHVKNGVTEVAGSPQTASTDGTQFTLSAGSYAVSGDGASGYAVTVSGSCAANGAITLQIGDDKTCHVTFDDGAPTLEVITQVVTDNGGTKTSANFSVHVRKGGVDAVGSPHAGEAGGTVFSLLAGAYTVSADAVPGYTMTTSGDCAGDGSITLAPGEARTCTLTANDAAATLTVIKRVVNDNGGTRVPADFSLHVEKGGADVPGSPGAGTAVGRRYTLAAGTYAVSEDAITGYVGTMSGACAANGAVTLKEGDAKTCTITNNDAKPRNSPLPPPVSGKFVNALPKSGTVKVKLPGTNTFVLLDKDKQIPVGSIVDTLKGRVTLVAAADSHGGTATADFYGGIFKLGQTRAATPITTLKLIEKLSCPRAGKATAAKKKKKKRHLWGDGKGKFRTSGSYSSATVRGTKWLVEDRCTSTLTRVARGKVAVRDLVKRKTVFVKAGKRYVAHARG